MTTTPKDMLLLKDEAGDYYVLPQELLERGRVPAEQTAEAERAFAAAEAVDVAGHLSLNFAKIKFEYRFVGTLVGGSSAIGAMVSNFAPGADVGGTTQDAAAQVESGLK